MDRAELVELLSPEGLRLLDSLPRWTGRDQVVSTVSRLRREGHSPGVVAAALTQSRLRARAEAKFGPFAERMLFTEAGLEQATRLRVAALHAGRFDAAGLRRIADLGCGIGGDALAMAAIDLEVTAVEADEVTAAIAAYNLTPFAQARVVHADAASVPLDDVDAAWLDPARRRVEQGTTTRLSEADYSPSLDTVFAIAERMPVGVKLGPGTDRDVIPDDAEAQWVSVDGDLVEMVLWTGVLARDGVRRAALVLRDDGAHEMTAAADSADEETGPLGAVVYEPDPAVIRSRLIGDLARRLGARMVGDGIAYLTADELTVTPFATAFRVLEQLPPDEDDLRRALRQRDIGVLEIKKRGVDVDPAALRKRLKLRGDRSATVILTRAQGRHVALLAERA
ncbi:class I SAM-dependent methyltransferase [Agromyces sp. SYSU T00194]|uniref:class I SAM-dependent methyltransferase n=1 Tax=Agromyces chitinivorans TaxID=3158560 RepID=UPI003393F90B